jgi:hypothetical protein
MHGRLIVGNALGCLSETFIPYTYNPARIKEIEYTVDTLNYAIRFDRFPFSLLCPRIFLPISELI